MPPPKDPEKYAEWIRKKSESQKRFWNTHPELKELVSQQHKGHKYNLGRIRTEESKRKQGEAIRGKNNHNYGKPMPEATRIKLSEVIKEQYKNGRVQSEEQRRKNREKNLGREVRQETRMKIREAKKGKLVSEDTRKLLSERHIGLQAQDKHPNWKGGITPLNIEIRHHQKYKEWAFQVMKRDNFKDWFSGVPLHGNAVAHHVISFSTLLKKNKIDTLDAALSCKELWDINNGITLSRKNHKAHHEMWGTQ